MTPIAADIYKAGQLAATLARGSDGTRFQYLDDYIEPGNRPVATSLPLTGEPLILAGGAVPPFFAGLLPEGRRLTALRRTIKTSADDEFSLLLAIGSDTIGDVQVVPQGQPPHPARPLVDVPADLTTFSFSDAVLGATGIDRRGLPGVQEKVSGRMINVPAYAHGEDIILKLAPAEFPHVIENEAYFLSVAEAVGVPTVRWQVLEDRDGVRALAIRRFDRIIEGGGTLRLAFEDASQVMKRWPADKYNVTLEEAVNSLLSLTPARAPAALALFRQVVFALLTGNGDQHAKNLAVLATAGGEWRVSPAYDLPSTLPYGDDTTALQMGGSAQPFSRKKVLAFAEDIGLPTRSAERALDTMLERIAPHLTEAQLSRVPFVKPLVRRLARSLAYRHRQLSA